MAVLSIQDVHFTYGGTPILDGVTLHIQAGERLCLSGRNGAGKSTLLKLAAGRIAPDRGRISTPKGSSVSLLEQDLPTDVGGTALEFAALAAGITAIPSTTQGQESDPESDAERLLAAKQALTRLGVDHDAPLDSLSGGAVRRVLLARALAIGTATKTGTGTEVILLDEPTNHLDIQTVLWLENHLVRLSEGRSIAVVFVTHDRAFARRLATRVVEVDRGRLISFAGSYDQFVNRRDQLLEQEAQQQAAFDKRLAQEETWLARGTKARRTRNEGRVRALENMREEYAARRQRLGSIQIQAAGGKRSGDLVIRAGDVRFRYGSAAPIVEGFSTVVLRGDRIGIAGPNGSGKTTLVRLLLGELKPQAGAIRHGTNLQIAYFDQMRTMLDPQRTLWENAGDGYDTVLVGGKTRHLKAHLEDFLFSESDHRKYVASLSGGEQNRLMLAKLFSRPANFLVLDEPTNDLDLDTLELLEEALSTFSGTVILVSHDRDFLDNVVTETLFLPGDGRVFAIAGGYSDIPGSLDRIAAGKDQARSGADGGADGDGGRPGGDGDGGRPSRRRSRDPKKLSFRENRELQALPDRITEMEAELERIHNRLADPQLYRSADDQSRIHSQSGGANRPALSESAPSGSGFKKAGETMPATPERLNSLSPSELTRRLEFLQQEIVQAYDRWEQLEDRNRGS